MAAARTAGAATTISAAMKAGLEQAPAAELAAAGLVRRSQLAGLKRLAAIGYGSPPGVRTALPTITLLQPPQVAQVLTPAAALAAIPAREGSEGSLAAALFVRSAESEVFARSLRS